MDIIERDGALYLSNGDGPYKNRDSAKRRIRKLAATAPLNLSEIAADFGTIDEGFADETIKQMLPRGHAAFRKHMNIPPMAFNDDPSAPGYRRNGYRPWHRR